MKKHLGFILSLLLILSCSSADHTNRQEPELYSEKHLDFKTWHRTNDCCTAQGGKIAVASGGTFSSKAGLEIASAGGNVVDVAVATAFGMAVERPHSLGLGGGGFFTLYLNGERPEEYFVDFRETAPAKASRDMYLDKSGKVIKGLSVDGALAVATPSFVVGLYDAHKKWGKLPWKTVLAPAIRLAKDGFPIYPSLARHIREEKDRFSNEPYTRSLLFNAEGEPLKEGDKLIQKDLSKTLERVARFGKNEFQTGKTARTIAEFLKKKGGVLQRSDLAGYHSIIRKPVDSEWHDYHIITAPPPSAGGTMIAEMLNVLGGYELVDFDGANYLHLLAQVMKRAYADRSRYIGDPDFFKEDISALTSKDYAKSLRSVINLKHDTPSKEINPGEFIPHYGNHTSHLSVIDADGNAVASTLTINEIFGSGLAVEGTGVFLNDEMDDFSAKPGEPNIFGLTGNEANAIAPFKRPVSSMSPTIVIGKDGKAVLSVGAAGGSRITSSVFEVILNVLERYPGDLKRAVFAPRIHHQWLADKLSLEGGFSDTVREQLGKFGYEFADRPFSALVQATYANPDRKLTAVFDPRDEGGAEAK